MSQGIVAETASTGSVTQQTDRHSKKPQPSSFFALVCLIKFTLCARVRIFLPTAQTNTAQHLRVAGSQKCLRKVDSEKEEREAPIAFVLMRERAFPLTVSDYITVNLTHVHSYLRISSQAALM